MAVLLDFEKPLEELIEQRDKAQETHDKGKVDMSDTITQLNKKLTTIKKDLYCDLSGWQKVQISRHPERPYTLDYINAMTKNFVELHGDRNFGDDKAMVGGLANRNFGMPNPEGYRKALRLFKMAEKFNLPVVCLIDTPGAFPGLEAEERGQGEAIAKNLMVMATLKVPIVCVIIGEGASGGALGIGVGDRVLMLENTWYSVISPESCSSILWRSWDYKEKAADVLSLTSEKMLKNKLIDGIIPEPLGGAHNDPDAMFKTLKMELKKNIKELSELSTKKLVNARIRKFSDMGSFTETA
jgi:acetyl-CoA carboxylase carboxyl transferase subunit alpha